MNLYGIKWNISRTDGNYSERNGIFREEIGAIANRREYSASRERLQVTNVGRVPCCFKPLRTTDNIVKT